MNDALLDKRYAELNSALTEACKSLDQIEAKCPGTLEAWWPWSRLILDVERTVHLSVLAAQGVQITLEYTGQCFSAVHREAITIKEPKAFIDSVVGYLAKEVGVVLKQEETARDHLPALLIRLRTEEQRWRELHTRLRDAYIRATRLARWDPPVVVQPECKSSCVCM